MKGSNIYEKILKKVPSIFLISLLEGAFIQITLQLAGYNAKGLWLLIFLTVFTISGIISFGLDCISESIKKKKGNTIVSIKLFKFNKIIKFN